MRAGPSPATVCLAFLGAVALFLPWMQGTGSAMTLNLRDLAEWCSLNPLSRHAWPPLGTSLGLRLLPVILLALTVWRRDTPSKVRVALALPVAIALLPPPELIIASPGDGNTQQQLLVALLALFCAPVGALRSATARAAHVALAALALPTSTLSMLSALDLQRSLGLEGTVGAGAALFVLVLLAFASRNPRKKRGDP